MKCTIAACPGQYEPGRALHTVRPAGRVVVIDHIPADVCNVCGDVLFAPETVRRIEELLSNLGQPNRTVPLFEYA